MNNTEQTYNAVPAIIKHHAGLPDNFINLTSDQKRFIMAMVEFERNDIKKTLLETLDEMKGLVNEL